MNTLHDHDLNRANAVCGAFIQRLDVLDRAIFDRLDDTDEPTSTITHLPRPMPSAANISRSLLCRSFISGATTIMDYNRIILPAVNADFTVLHTRSDPGLAAAIARWANWETVEGRWPFVVSGGDEVVQGYVECFKGGGGGQVSDELICVLCAGSGGVCQGQRGVYTGMRRGLSHGSWSI